jgi:DNA-binding MarR family transcriptional regulator
MLDHFGQENYITDGDVSNDLYHLFARAEYLTFRAREKELQRYRLSPQQSQIIMLVKASNGKISPAELSRNLLKKHNSISNIITRMESNGLLEKKKAKKPRNLIIISLTEKGNKAYEIITREGAVQRILSSLDKNERQEFRTLLENLMEKAKKELGLYGDEYSNPELDDWDMEPEGEDSGIKDRG